MSLRRYAVAIQALFVLRMRMYKRMRPAVHYICITKHFYNLKDSHVGGLDLLRNISYHSVLSKWHGPQTNMCVRTYVRLVGR